MNDRMNEINRIMSGPGTMVEKGEAASRFVARLRAGKCQPAEQIRPAFRPKRKQLPEDWLHDPRNLWLGGYWRYMLDCEGRALDEARRRIAEDRPLWRQHFLEMMEHHLRHETDPDIVAGLKRELHKVRKALGLIKPAPETLREQNRVRVRRHRAKQAGKA